MTTNTNAAQVANNLIAVAEDQAFEAWYKQDCLVGGVNARIAARAAWNARAALTTAAAVPPEGWVMVPVELAQRVQESLGEFLMDHGWSQRDMDTSDDFGAVLLAAAPKAEPVPAGEREELREGASYESMNLAAMVLSDCGHSSNYQPLLERVAGRIDRHVERLLTAQQADRAMRAQAAPENIRSILVRCREFIDTTKAPAYPAGADLADEIDVLLAAQVSPEPAGECGNCFDGKSDMDHDCRKCGGTGIAQAAPAAVAGPSEILEKINSLISSINEAHRSQNSGWRQGCFDAADNTYKQIKDMLYAAPTTQATPQPAPVAQGDAMTYEREHAIRQGHEIASSDAYFQARPQIDGLDRRNVFRAGFERGWDAARSQAKEGA